jgi:hypothetical protein
MKSHLISLHHQTSAQQYRRFNPAAVDKIAFSKALPPLPERCLELAVQCASLIAPYLAGAPEQPDEKMEQRAQSPQSPLSTGVRE